MAGERKGKTYEAVVKVVLNRLATAGVIKEPVHWNVRPNAMTIEPDFTIGSDSDNPSMVLLVTHSGSAKESEKKFWRNMGELAEAKSALKRVPHVFSIAFEAEIKQALKEVQEAAFDGQLIVGDLSYGSALEEWIDANHAALPTPGPDKVDAITSLAKDDKALRSALVALTKDVRTLLDGRQPALEQLWAQHRKRAKADVSPAKDTRYRKGFTKAMVLGISPAEMQKPLKGNWDWASPLGLVRKSLVGFKVVDDDLLWLASSPLKTVNPSDWSGAYVSQGFRDQVQKVRSVSLLVEFQRYVTENLADLQSTAGMRKHLARMHKDPGQGLALPAGVPAPAGVWLFDFVGALVKAKAKKSQAFGYSTFSSHAKSAESKVGNMNLGTWCTCFMNQYFSRKSDFVPPKAAVEFVAEVLAEHLCSFTAAAIQNLATEIQERYIAKELTAVLLTHRGFDPIGALVKSRPELVHAIDVRIQSCFAERAALGGSGASTGVVIAKTTLINWQSAHDSHTNDKRKELCGRAVSLRYTWDASKACFVARPGVKKLVLIVDGTWTQDDLDALAKAGWDEILYPDQMDKLEKALA